MQFFSPAFILAILLHFSSAPSQQSAFPASATSSSSSSSVSFAQRVSLTGVPNMGKISEHLFRGAQPDISNLVELKKRGITTIVDLRSESFHTRQLERAHAESLGLRFVSIPVGGFSNPTSKQLAQFFSLLRQTPPENVFIHCHFGEDRTGVFIAAYRIAFEKWSADQALSEMNAFGFNHTWHPSMITFVRQFPDRIQSDAVLKPFLPN
jgi:tyrosine-protein phosphatase SIW14